MKTKKPYLSAQNITIRIRDKFLFENTSWEMREGEQWLIVGGNGAGKTTFAKALAGLLPLKTGEVILHFVKDSQYPYPQTNRDKIAYVSFDTEQELLGREEYMQDLEAQVGAERKRVTVKEFMSEELGIRNYELSRKVVHKRFWTSQKENIKCPFNKTINA